MIDSFRLVIPQGLSRRNPANPDSASGQNRGGTELRVYDMLGQSSYDTLLESHHWWWIGRRKVVSELLSTLNLPKSIVILDIGCGTGGSLRMLSQYGKVLAVDLDSDALAQIPLGYARVQNDMTHMEFDNNSIDTIVAMDVLEHIENDLAALAEARRVLRPSGYVVATVPAHMNLWTGGDVSLGHYRRYELDELRKKFTRQGFEVKKISYFVVLTLPVVYVMRFISKMTHPDSGLIGKIGVSMPSKAVNKSLIVYMSLESQLLKKVDLPLGSSIICVARKS